MLWEMFWDWLVLAQLASMLAVSTPATEVHQLAKISRYVTRSVEPNISSGNHLTGVCSIRSPMYKVDLGASKFAAFSLVCEPAASKCSRAPGFLCERNSFSVFLSVVVAVIHLNVGVCRAGGCEADPPAHISCELWKESFLKVTHALINLALFLGCKPFPVGLVLVGNSSSDKLVLTRLRADSEEKSVFCLQLLPFIRFLSTNTKWSADQSLYLSLTGNREANPSCKIH